MGSEDLPGLIPLSVATILARCTGTWCSVEISYYEVYMERCYDLLKPMTLDDKFGNLQLKGLAWFGRALLLLPDRRVLLRPLHHLRRLDELAKPGYPAWHASTVQRDGLKDIYHVVSTLYMICSLYIYMYA